MKKNKAAKIVWRELRDAYAAIDRVPENDENELHRVIGQYDALKRVYALITGMGRIDVANKVVTWYVKSEHYHPENYQFHPENYPAP